MVGFVNLDSEAMQSDKEQIYCDRLSYNVGLIDQSNHLPEGASTASQFPQARHRMYSKCRSAHSHFGTAPAFFSLFP
jgi:hypothetical protein